MKRWCKHSGKAITRDWEECDSCRYFKTVRCEGYRPIPKPLAMASFMDWFERTKTNERMLPESPSESECNTHSSTPTTKEEEK